ncbi:metallophosphoesterase [Desulfarculus baarsii DSM 2075]|uniref:Metallophosphoesterase n=1 Tax=Desulfarculus baarsii (strain ATCC 33931 / DSM 2075 / LMG 7858 / VKM B-1802 / 2st14) TaxID=644282 RepID=E1QGG0_DESB2|nr:TIGR00282 family metallophosphoesterase [Desulfarculus baarsii]ADK83672.1 metallophosphoesterase [Desulfarculus baarsii DSM 2075]
MKLTILHIGDIFGAAGRQALAALLPGLKASLRPDLVIANGENSAGGIGITPETAGEIFLAGVDVITTGNHVWRHREIEALLDDEPHLLRPHNYPGDAPGRGWVIARTQAGPPVGVLNLEGRVFMSQLDCPFACAEEILAGPLAQTPVIIVDFHAEATSEKAALAWRLDGRVSAVLGTHTHVPTADERILPGGTAFQSDVGMTGPHDSIIGVETEVAIQRFLTARPARFRAAEENPRLQATVVEVDAATGAALHIQRIDAPLSERPGQP